MKKIMILTIFAALILAFGCVSGPAPSRTSPGTGSGSPTSTGGVRTPTTDAIACYTNCEVGGSPGIIAVCKAGCTMDWAKNTRDPTVCETTLNDAALGEMKNNYYYGCLDGVAGAMNSITPCSAIPTIARQNACIEAAATDAQNPGLCDSMQKDNNDPNVQEAYDRAFATIVNDCKRSARGET